MAFTIKGLPPGSHTNAALPENELDAELFNEYESLFLLFEGQLDSLTSFIQSLDTYIQFVTDTDDDTSSVTGNFIITVAVTTGTGEVEPFTSVVDATIEIISDTTGTATIDGGVIPVTKVFSNGVFTITLNASTTGEVVLGIQGPHVSGLDVTDTHTHTYV